MRHLARGVVVGTAICSVAPAQAADHLMVVNEVLLSKGGDTGIQFIELEDPGELFPSNPYTLQVYDADATMIGSVQLTVPASTTRFLIATAAADTAYGTDSDEPLTVTLPANGQACFTRGQVKIHCVAWGCLNTVLVGATRAPSPATDMSIQRQSNGFYQVGTPTADTANQVGTTMSNCPTEPDAPPPVDGPPSPDAGVTPDAIDDGLGDAGNTGGNNNPDDGGGCCQVDGSRGAAGAFFLAVGVLLALRRSRRR